MTFRTAETSQSGVSHNLLPSSALLNRGLTCDKVLPPLPRAKCPRDTLEGCHGGRLSSARGHKKWSREMPWWANAFN